MSGAAPAFSTEESASDDEGTRMTNTTDALRSLFAPPQQQQEQRMQDQVQEKILQEEEERLQKAREIQRQKQPIALDQPTIVSIPPPPRTSQDESMPVSKSDEQTPLLMPEQNRAESHETNQNVLTPTGQRHRKKTVAGAGITPPSTQVFDSLFGEAAMNDTAEPSTKLFASSHEQLRQPRISDQTQSASHVQTLLTRLEPLASTSTWTGAFVFLLYHIVFCLAQASTIRHGASSTTGLLAQMAALGVIFAGPCMIYQTSPQIPAVYPASDLFLAPFLARMATDVDEVLQSIEPNRSANNADAVFMATFGALFATALFLSGLWCVAAARIRLANVGNFLPHPVLTGFFTTIGILMWTLAFTVDTNGQTVAEVFSSGDWQETIAPALWHHMPSFGIGLIMHVTNPILHPTMVIGWIAITIVGCYTVMALGGISLAEAQENEWFFSWHDLATGDAGDAVSLWPGGIWWSVFVQGNISWPAYRGGIRNMLALTVLYLIRCSLHAAALKKNVRHVTRSSEKKDEDGETRQKMNSGEKLKDEEDNGNLGLGTYLSDAFAVPLEGKIAIDRRAAASPNGPSSDAKNYHDTKRKLELGYILENGYAYAQFVSAIVGGLAVAPAVAASQTLFHLGAERAAPQYGSCLLLIWVYWTDFAIVQYIPKPAFSSLLVLAGLDMVRAWMVRSYQQTKSKGEWMVAPLLVVLAFWLGLLNAIFIGVAISTFWFAASFHRAGTVKFVGSGLTLRSTMERGFDQAAWLERHADYIQILVLQNYLFFGNVQSVSNYVTTMFEEYVPEQDDHGRKKEPDFDYIPPLPKHLILDFMFVTGMDTAAVDFFREILTLCQEQGCKLYLAGMSSELRSLLVHARVVTTNGASSANKSGHPSLLPTTASQQQQGSLFHVDLESALAKAEDALISTVFHLEWRDKEETKVRQHERRLRSAASSPAISSSSTNNGFLYALDQILLQHGDAVASAVERLQSLAPFATLVELQTGQILTEDTGGLYFVETGLMRVRHADSRGSLASISKLTNRRADDHGTTLSGWNARSVGRHSVFQQQQLEENAASAAQQGLLSDTASGGVDPFVRDHPTFRLARIGHGWVTGSLPLASGKGTPSSPAAVTKSAVVHVAVSPCRLHHVSHDVLVELEKTHPDTVLHLYKLLAFLSWKRQEMTIAQLNQFVRILQSPTPRLRQGKPDLGRAIYHDHQHHPFDPKTSATDGSVDHLYFP